MVLLAFLLFLSNMLLLGVLSCYWLLLETFKFLMVSCYSLCYYWRSWSNQWCCWCFCYSFRTCCCWRSCSYWLSCCCGVLTIATVPADPGVHILAGGFTYCIVEWDVLHYLTIRLWLSYCNFFSAIELSEYRISYWRIQETIGLSDIGSRPQSIGLSDIGLKKNVNCPPLLNSTQLRVVFIIPRR